jgi:hypothetical protein
VDAPRARIDAGVPAIAFVAGAALGTTWDRFHVAAGTLSYPHARWGQPWWVPVEFALAFAAVVSMIAWAGGPSPGEQSPRRAAVETLLFTSVYGFTSLTWRSPYACAATLAVLAVARRKTFASLGGRNVRAAIGLVAVGPAVEASLSSAGLFAYAPQHLIARVPVWLPLLYLHAVPLAVRATEGTMWLRARRDRREPVIVDA